MNVQLKLSSMKSTQLYGDKVMDHLSLLASIIVCCIPLRVIVSFNAKGFKLGLACSFDSMWIGRVQSI